MGIFSRLSDIVSANIVHMLDKAEDPEKMVRLMIQEMEETLVEVKSTAAKFIADQKLLERRFEFLGQDMDAWQAKAELAVRKNRDDLARAALSEKNKIESAIAKNTAEMAHNQEQVDKLKEDIQGLTRKLDDARQRQKLIVSRRQTAEQQLRVQSTMERMNSFKAFEKFEQYESHIDRLEGELESRRNGGGQAQTLSEQFQQLEQDERIESELAALKRAFHSGNSEDQPVTVN
ncbi:MAG: phage shock protein PspA [Oligoflexus sp.]